jgi:signal transduction histidine kinase
VNTLTAERTSAPRTRYSQHTRVEVAERLLIAGLRAQERADEAEAARARLAFLFKASQRLAVSLETATVLQTVLDLVVPELADAASLHILAPGSRMAQVTTVTSDAFGDRTPEWWSWFERTTGASVKRAMRLGTSACATVAPKGSRGVPFGGPTVSYLVVPLRARGRGLGALRMLSVTPRQIYRRDDLSLPEAFANGASLALDNASLYQQQLALVAHLEQVRGQLDAAQTEWLRDDERQRIARDLHDHVEQAFFAIGLTATAALDGRRRAQTVDELTEALGWITQLSAAGAEQLRGALFALKRTRDSRHGLVSVLRTLVRSFQERTGVEADLVVTGSESDIHSQVNETVHAVVREALANVERHANARSTVVSLQLRPRSVTLIVHDDGVGAPNLVLERLSSSALHFGLHGLRQRVRRLNGRFSARSGPEGGFVVRARLPLVSEAAK